VVIGTNQIKMRTTHELLIDAKSDHAYNGWFDEESHTLNDVQELIATFGASNWNDDFDRNHLDNINEVLGLN